MRVIHVAWNAGAAVSPMLASIAVLDRIGCTIFPSGPRRRPGLDGIGASGATPAAAGGGRSRPPSPRMPRFLRFPSSQEKPAASTLTKKANARELFGAVKEPANLATRSIGFYAKGCLAGGKPLPVNGPAWQVMRLSRNRNWGHPSLIRYVERFATDAKQKDGWPGLLVGDLSMPRGGPMPYGHSSHQVGLDVDIWYKPAPDHELSAEERESMKMESFLLDPGHVNPEVWKPEYEQLLRRAVSYPEVARIFVNPAIKKWLCDNAKGDRGYLSQDHPDHGPRRSLPCAARLPGQQSRLREPGFQSR